MIPNECIEKTNELRSEIMEKIADGPSELVNYISFSLINNGFESEDCDNFIKKAFVLYNNGNEKRAAFGEGIAGSAIGGISKVQGAIHGASGTATDLANLATLILPLTRYGKPTFMQKVKYLLGQNLPVAVGAGILGALGAKRLIEDSRNENLSHAALKEILDEKPEIATDPNTAKYYTTIRRFAPALASDKHILESALEHAHEYGRLDYPMMKELIDMQVRLKPSESHYGTGNTISSTLSARPVATLMPKYSPQGYK